MEKMLNGQRIWDLVDMIEKLYLTRKSSITQIAEELGVPEYVVSKTLRVLDYDHTLKRNAETRLHGKLVHGVLTPEKFPFIEKYIYNEEE